jgi:pheromone shutdown protein TraB
VVVVWVVSEFDTVVGVSAVASEDWVIWAGVLEVGVVGAGAELTACVVADAVAVFTGLIGDVGFVGLSIDFLQLFDVVTQGCHTGLP